MREILFRGKKKYNGKWVEGYYTKGFRNPDGSLEDMIYMFSKDENERRKFNYAIVIPETVGQYTGLTDKNGNKIFEGDIVLYPWRYSQKRRFCIKFVEGEFVAEPVIRSHDIWAIRIGSYASDFEIIGNIHDNPELLGGADNG